MASTQKPTIVFIPGAWHSPEYFSGVISALQGQGYSCVTVSLPSVGQPGASATVADDAVAIQKVTSKIADEGKEMIIAMHSYGGIPGTESAKGLVKADREKEGKQGGIVGLVYLAAFLLPEGASLVSFLGGLPDWIKFDGNKMTVEGANWAFYNDLPSSQGDLFTKKLSHQAAESFKTPLTYPAYTHLPTTYLLCEEDHAIPFGGQQAMAGIGGPGVKQHVCGSAHSPMLSRPKVVEQVIRSAAGEAIEVEG